MARNFFARLFHRNDNAKQAIDTAPSNAVNMATAPALPVAPAPVTPPTAPASVTDPSAANAITTRQCLSCGRDLRDSQAVCPSCGLVLQTAAP